MESSICENETDSCESIEQIWIKFFSICVCCTSFQSHRLLFCVCLWFLSFISSSCTFHLTDSASAKTQVVCLSSTHLKSSGQHAFFCQVPLLWNCFACVWFLSLISSSCTFHLLCASAETLLHFISPTVHLPEHKLFVFLPLNSSLLVSMPFFVKYHYSGTICPTISDHFLPWHHLNLPSRPIFSPLDWMPCLCMCSCVPLVLRVCVGKLLNEEVYLFGF